LSPKLLNITQLRSNCRAGYALPAHFRDSVPHRREKLPPEIAVKVTSTLHAWPQSSWLKRNCEAIAGLLCPIRNFRESVPAAGGTEIAVEVTSVLHDCHQSC
jgi:hypothetical protein